MFAWRRKDARVLSPEEPTPHAKKEPTFPRDEKIERMEFLLSLKKRGISNAAVLRAMDSVPREQFVLADYADAAYADSAMPIACGQTISQPYVVAYMTEQLEVTREHRVLEVGTGSGYQTAVLGLLAGQVYSIERYRTLADRARETLEHLGYDNVTVVPGDGFLGLPEHAPYDRIMVTAAAETIPEALTGQLAEGGILLLPLGAHDGAQRIVKLTVGQEGLAQQDLLPVRFVPLLPGQAQEL
jgi:protein-L-isoaspartate(D-aspartate) O-methyltransferase